MFRRLFFIMCVAYLMVSCNPKLHVVGAGMRHHNLSQNKYQPGKNKKPVRIGSSPLSPFWLLFKSH